MKTETIQLNSVIYKVGYKYLYKIINSGTINEQISKIKISEIKNSFGGNTRTNLLGVINDKEYLLDTEIHETVARIYKYKDFY